MKKKVRNIPPGFGRVIDRKKGEVKRVYFPPENWIRYIHKIFLQNFRIKYPTVADCLHPHIKAGNTFFVKMDLADAFGSIYFEKVNKVLSCKGLNRRRMYFFHKEGGVIQGAPASPAIFHVFCQLTIDKELREYCEKRSVVYTRYVDDIIFSSKSPIPKNMRRVLRKIIHKHDFELNPGKDVVISTWRRPLKILGTVIYKGKVQVTTKFLNQYRDYLACNEDGQFNAKIRGMKAWIKYVNNLN